MRGALPSTSERLPVNNTIMNNFLTRRLARPNCHCRRRRRRARTHIEERQPCCSDVSVTADTTGVDNNSQSGLTSALGIGRSGTLLSTAASVRVTQATALRTTSHQQQHNACQ